MRVKWILAGVVGTSAAAFASPTVSFQTILNQGDPIPGTGDFFGGAEQVVVGTGGNVAVIGELEVDSNNIIIYNTPSGAGRNNLDVLQSSTPTSVNGWGTNKVSNSSTQTFDGFDNLALTSNPSSGVRLSFVATSGGSDGILQADLTGPVASPTSTLGDVAFDGDGQGYTIPTAGSTGSGSGTIEMQVNPTGQVLFPATFGGKTVLGRGDVSGLASPPEFTSNSPTLAIRDLGDRVALAADNTGAAILTASGTNGIYSTTANGSSQTKLSGTQTPVVPDSLIGYYSSGGNSAALMTVTAGASQDVYLEKNNGTPVSILSSPITPSIPVQGEMTPNGKIALYLSDSTNGDTIRYADAGAANSSASVIASVATPSETTLTAPATAVALDPTASSLLIEGLQEPGGGTPWVPEINAVGTTIFDAEIGTSVADEKMALLDWKPGNLSPTVLIAVGDSVVIGGQSATIDGLFPNTLTNESDNFKDTISDDNYVAVNVSYDYPSDPDNVLNAVLLTQLSSSPVPEPATLALLSISGLSLLARRRR